MNDTDSSQLPTEVKEVETSKNDCTQMLAHKEEKIESSNKQNDDINLIIRCPFTTTDLNICIDQNSTVLILKKKIYKEFPSHPKPSDQKLIYGGRIIINTEIIADILKRSDNKVTQTIHLIINSLAIQNTYEKNVKRTSNSSTPVSSKSTPVSSTNNSPSTSSISSISTSINVNENQNNINVSNKHESSTTNNSTLTNTKTESTVLLNNNNNTNTNSTTTTTTTTTTGINNQNTTISSTTTSSSVNDSLTNSSTPIQTLQPTPNFIQYVLINNIIYAVQPAPKIDFSTMSSIPLNTSVETDATRNVEQVLNDENNNNNNNNNEQQQAENLQNQAQQAAFNQLFDDAPQEEHPNQFFLFIRLGFVTYLLSQNGGYLRMIIVTLISIIIFLYQTGRLRITVINVGNLNQQLNNNNNNNNIENNNVDNINNNNNINNDVNGNGNGNDNDNENVVQNQEVNENQPLLNENNGVAPEVVEDLSLFVKCKRIFFAFFLSLIPSLQEVA